MKFGTFSDGPLASHTLQEDAVIRGGMVYKRSTEGRDKPARHNYAFSGLIIAAVFVGPRSTHTLARREYITGLLERV